MERLTKYLASGAADYNYPAGCYSGNDCNDRVAKSAYRQTCVERLAAYEETGLTPEESKRMSNILMDVGIDYNCSWEYVKNWLLDDRLRELDEADKDGRVVVLPCKVGDTVYLLFAGNPNNPVISTLKINTVAEAVKLIGKMGMHKYIGTFRTREEAEKALEAIQNE